MKAISKKYMFFHGDMAEVVFLRQYIDLFDKGTCMFFVDSESQKGLRREFDGLVALVGKINGRETGLLACDFKIYGGSFGVENSHKACVFIREMKKRNIPILFFLETIGVRIMEGRKTFPFAFRILRELVEFKEFNLLMTAAVGPCLGLGALLYEMGDYRFGIRKKSTLNLTGPEVFKMFFGSEVNFDEIASVEKQQNISALVHEIADSKLEIMKKIRKVHSFRAAGISKVFNEPFEVYNHAN